MNGLLATADVALQGGLSDGVDYLKENLVAAGLVAIPAAFAIVAIKKGYRMIRGFF